MQAVKTRLKHNEELALININRVGAVIFKLKGCMARYMCPDNLILIDIKS